MGDDGVRAVEVDGAGDDFFRTACCLVVLTKDGRVEQSIDELVVATLGQSNEQQSLEDVISDVRAAFGTSLARSLVAESLRRLQDVNKVRAGASGTNYVLTGQEYARFRKRIAEATDLESRVRNEWLESLPTGPVSPKSDDGRELWGALIEYLGRAFRRHAAETALLLDPATDAEPESELGRTFGSILGSVASKRQNSDRIVNAVKEFFQSPSDARIEYLAQLADGAFAVSALGVDKPTAEYLQTTLEPLTIFLDTNFIYGVLGLHDNPYVNVSNELVEVLRTNKFPFRLTVHPRTVLEFRQSLDRARQNLVERDWKPSLSKELMDREELSGIERRYHRQNADKPTNPDAFLLGYDAVEVRLAEIGASVYVPDMQSAGNRLDTEILIRRYGDFLQGRKDKAPGPLEHDIIVWEEVQRLQRHAAGLLGSAALFLTTDHFFFTFDWTKLKAPRRLGSTVMPSHLLQLLRPFVPTTEDFNRRFVDTFSLAEFRIIDPDSSRIASKIASYLTQFEDLDPKTASGLISNSILRDRLIALEREPREFMRVIDQQVGLENRALGIERDAYRRQADELAVQVKTLEERLNASATAGAHVEASELPPGTMPSVGSRELAEGGSADGDVREVARSEAKPVHAALPTVAPDVAGPKASGWHRRWEGLLVAVVLALAGGLLWVLWYNGWTHLAHRNGVIVAGGTVGLVVGYCVGDWPPSDVGAKVGVVIAVLTAAGLFAVVVD